MLGLESLLTARNSRCHTKMKKELFGLNLRFIE